jgi:phosphate transport system substrate-binding protein
MRADERQACQAASVGFVELPVAFDGIAVVVHPDNDWVDQLTVDELATIWTNEEVETWSDVRETWPKEPLNLYGPGLDSGTYDYFGAAILNGDSSRADYDSSEDDDVIVESIAGDAFSLGYFSLAYVGGDKAKVRVVPIDDGDDDNGVGAIEPTVESIADQKYQPLSRPVFVYVSTTSAERPEVSAFVDFILDGVPAIADDAGFARLPPRAYKLAKQRFGTRTTGSAFEGGAQVGVRIENLLAP